MLIDAGGDSLVVGEDVSENVVAADIGKRLAVVLVSLVTVVVVGAGVVGTDVAAEVVETVCVVEKEDVVRVVRTAVLVAAADKLVEGTVLVALCGVLGRTEIIVVMVAGDEEDIALEVVGSVVVNLEVAMGRVVEASVVVAEVVVSS